MITSAREDSILRPFVEEILAFSVTDPGPAGQKFFLDTLHGKNNIPPLAVWDGRLDQMLRDARGYLTGEHTVAYGVPKWWDEQSMKAMAGIDFLALQMDRVITNRP